MAVTFLLALRSSSQILTRAFMTTKITSVCDGDLSRLLWVMHGTCHSSFSCNKHDAFQRTLLYSFHDRLAQGQTRNLVKRQKE